MNGYILYGQAGGEIVRIDAQRASRDALRRVLTSSVPAGQSILGIVFGPQEQTHLRALPHAS